MARVGGGRTWRWLARHRLAVQVAIDSVAWVVALSFAVLARYDFNPQRIGFRGLALMAPLVVFAQFVAGQLCGLYTGRWRFGSFEEVASLARAAALTSATAYAIDLWVEWPRMVPLSTTIAGGVVALVLMGGARYGWRLFLERRRLPKGENCERFLVLGAGDGGAQVITAMLRDPTSPYLPVALLDDDPAKANLRIRGVPVVGTRRNLAEAARRYSAHTVLIAIPSAGTDVVGEVVDAAKGAHVNVKVLPPLAELFGANIGTGDIRDVTEADLLGRRVIEVDLDAIADYVSGKRVLVTGAGGSIGSELCRQIYRFAPAGLVMVDRDESALHAVQLSIEGRALLDSPDLVLLDIQDGDAVERLFAERDPQVVFHAAALKHLPLLERHPAEAVKANVWATLGLLQVAAASGVERFVNISTDKAADPSSVLGYTKRIGEQLTAHFAALCGGSYLSVRFGNVLGSRGSVLTTFRAQIESGGPITVTHPDATRYFMTVEEAVQLVINAGAVGGPGEVLVLDMGQPVRIVDVAERLAVTAARPVDIVFTGLRPGEKLHEVLLGRDENGSRPSHPLISHVPVAPLAPEQLEILVHVSRADLVGALASLCTGETLEASINLDA